MGLAGAAGLGSRAAVTHVRHRGNVPIPTLQDQLVGSSESVPVCTVGCQKEKSVRGCEGMDDLSPKSSGTGPNKSPSEETAIDSPPLLIDHQ